MRWFSVSMLVFARQKASSVNPFWKLNDLKQLACKKQLHNNNHSNIWQKRTKKYIQLSSSNGRSPSIPSSFITKEISQSLAKISGLSCWILEEWINELLPFLDENQRRNGTRWGFQVSFSYWYRAFRLDSDHAFTTRHEGHLLKNSQWVSQYLRLRSPEDPSMEFINERVENEPGSFTRNCSFLVKLSNLNHPFFLVGCMSFKPVFFSLNWMLDALNAWNLFSFCRQMAANSSGSTVATLHGDCW